jgi:hypothetical protein
VPVCDTLAWSSGRGTESSNEGKDALRGQEEEEK